MVNIKIEASRDFQQKHVIVTAMVYIIHSSYVTAAQSPGCTSQHRKSPLRTSPLVECTNIEYMQHANLHNRSIGKVGSTPFSTRCWASVSASQYSSNTAGEQRGGDL